MKKLYIFNLITEKWINKSTNPLCVINNIRFNYIKSKIILKNMHILDIGCGSGLLTEKLSFHCKEIIAIDKSKDLINIAQNKNTQCNLKIKYLNDNINTLSLNNKFDLIICMELLEHIQNKNILIKIMKNHLKKNGVIILSSLNKNIITYLKIILLGEFVYEKIHKNTHIYNKLTKISTLKNILSKEKIKIIDIKEIIFNPFLNYSQINKNPKINYLVTLKNDI